MKRSFSLLFLFVCLLRFTGYSQNGTANSDMLENILPAVITVGVYETDASKKSLGFRGDPSTLAYAKMLDLSGANSSGSGFLIKYNNKPYVITNAHVIEQAASTDGSIYVYSINRSKYKVRVVGGDSFYDIAVLQFVDAPGSEVNFLEFRDAPARIGEQVFAIGNPLGEYPYSVSDGIVSAKNRVRGGLTGKFGFLQTTATVIWGNSGGPLVDANGKVVGINSQIAFANNQGSAMWQPQINFALEAPLAQRLVNDIFNNDGVIKRAFFGIELVQKKLPYQPGTQEYVYYSRLYKADELPVLNTVDATGPALNLKAYEGAQIKAINDEPVRNLEEALGELEKVIPGQGVYFTLLLNNKESRVQVKNSTLNANATARIGKSFMDKAGLNYHTDRNHFIVDISGQSGGYAMPVNTRSDQQQVSDIPAGSYEVLGMGLLDKDFESVWRISDLADAGTAVRLTGMLGAVDILLFRTGADPESKDSYLKKRVYLGKDEKLIQQTLWY